MLHMLKTFAVALIAVSFALASGVAMAQVTAPTPGTGGGSVDPSPDDPDSIHDKGKHYAKGHDKDHRGKGYAKGHDKDHRGHKGLEPNYGS